MSRSPSAEGSTAVYEATARYLIVNGDDFGASHGINHGITEAWRDGILTSASLMVNMPASRQAAALAGDLQGLSVGLHVNLTDEGPPAVEVTDTAAIRAELRHQLEVFRDLVGRPPTHVDSHHNVHRQPELLPLFLELARESGAPMREHSPARYLEAFYGQWDGQAHLEQVSVSSLVGMLRDDSAPGVTELGCHPGYFDPDFRSVYHREREAELRTLCDPRVRRAVERLGIHLVSFGDAKRLFEGRM